MIKYTDQSSISNQLFSTPFQQKLDRQNRWYVLSEILPWDKMASVYMQYMCTESGRTTIDLRVVMGAMYIQHMLNLTDRETIDTISENIYMQYFVGLSSFQTTAIFDHSLLSIFRQRLGNKGGIELNEVLLHYAIENGIVKHRKPRTPNDKSKKENTGDTQSESTEVDKSISEKQVITQVKSKQNRGTVKVDATVAPQDITYPTDTKLLNHSRLISEQIVDVLFDQCREQLTVKPRTYRREAKDKWLDFSKKRKPSKKAIRQQIKKQLGYLGRNLNHIEDLLSLVINSGAVVDIEEQLRKKLYVISEIYRQHKQMYDTGSKSIKDRIVSVSQPWVRPIVRGKAGKAVEFGAKINLSLTEKYITVDHSSFDAFNEGKGLIEILKNYERRFGYYPEYALVDKIYLNRENRSFMKAKNIKHNGNPLGRPKAIDSQQKSKRKKKSSERNHIEGKIGQAKQAFGMDRIRTKTKASSYCAIHMIAMAINMITLLKKRYLAIKIWIVSLAMDQKAMLYRILYCVTNKSIKLRFYDPA